MLTSLPLLALTLSTAYAQFRPQIVGGKPVAPGDYLFLTGIRRSEKGANFCGGSLVGPKSVLTAAHCVSPNDEIWVSLGSEYRVGSDDGEQIQVSNIAIHPAYANLAYDVAILTLSRPANASIPIVKLPPFVPSTGPGPSLSCRFFGCTFGAGQACQCDPLCTQYGDCCDDYQDFCDANSTRPSSCIDDGCTKFAFPSLECQCNPGCVDEGNCCDDYDDVCSAEPIPSPTLPVEEPGTPATIIGWGRLSEGGASPSKRQQVTVPLLSNEQCVEKYPNLQDTMICAGVEEGGKDSCQGDSGGPMFVTDDQGELIQVGIVSWGKGCARPGLPGVYARVSTLVDFIDQSIIS